MTKNSQASPFWEEAIQKDLYKRVFEIFATADEGTRQWQIIQTIFEYMHRHLNASNKGLAVHYARMGAKHSDGIHSLYETALYGSSPWPLTEQEYVYWGRTHLGGWAAELQRIQFWSRTGPQEHLIESHDTYEQSACACPVVQGNRMAGVLLISSTQPAFFDHPLAEQVIHNYALLLNLAFKQSDFYPFTCINLRIMPDLCWQRAEVKRIYVTRLLHITNQMDVPYHEAKDVVRDQIESEFEQTAMHDNQATS